MSDLTITQKRVIKAMGKAPNGQRQIAGNGMAPFLQSARSLVRKGLLMEWRTSQFSLTDEGKEAFVKLEGKS